jgi:hypothetical protein
MKKPESYDRMAEYYNISCNGRKLYTCLNEDEYFDIMNDMAIQYYQTGSPNPADLKTEIVSEKNHYGNEKENWSDKRIRTYTGFT